MRLGSDAAYELRRIRLQGSDAASGPAGLGIGVVHGHPLTPTPRHIPTGQRRRAAGRPRPSRDLFPRRLAKRLGTHPHESPGVRRKPLARRRLGPLHTCTGASRAARHSVTYLAAAIPRRRASSIATPSPTAKPCPSRAGPGWVRLALSDPPRAPPRGCESRLHGHPVHVQALLLYRPVSTRRKSARSTSTSASDTKVPYSLHWTAHKASFHLARRRWQMSVAAMPTKARKCSGLRTVQRPSAAKEMTSQNL